MTSTTETRNSWYDEIVDNAEERELWIVGQEVERPPYFHRRKRRAIRGSPGPFASVCRRQDYAEL